MAFFVIGLWPVAAVEALALWRVYRVPFVRTYALGLVGNAITWVVGLVTAAALGSALESAFAPRTMFYGLPAITVGVVALAFVLSGLLEWPFYRFAFPPGFRQARRTIPASFAAQCASYVVLVIPALWMLWGSSYSLYHQARLDPSLSFVRGVDAWVYYLDRHDRAVHRVRVDGRGDERVMPVPRAYAAGWTSTLPRLAVMPGRRKGAQELWIAHDDRSAPLTPLAVGLASPFAEGRGYALGWHMFQAADLRPLGAPMWDVRIGFWGSEAFHASAGRPGDPDIDFGLDTPLVFWQGSNATILPGDIAVWQFGPGILAAHLPTRRLGWVAEGQGPVVVLEMSAAARQSVH